jgi:hypothetical protein
MNEDEWLTATGPLPLINFRWHGEGLCRKWTLLALAFCSRIWHLIPEEGRRLAQVVERYVEGAATPQEVAAARLVVTRMVIFRPFADTWALRAASRFHPRGDPFSSHVVSLEAAHAIVRSLPEREDPARVVQVWAGERLAQVALVHDILGPPPSHTVTVAPAWQTPDVMALAGHIYHDRAFGRMRELAELLEEAGCTDAQLLDHFRGPGPHVRGCHVLDLLLGRE